VFPAVRPVPSAFPCAQCRTNPPLDQTFEERFIVRWQFIAGRGLTVLLLGNLGAPEQLCLDKEFDRARVSLERARPD
jgi:hypothetical protein